MSKLVLKIKRVVTNTKTGKVISTKKGEAHSFLEQFLQILSVHMAHEYNVAPDTKTIVNTAGGNFAYITSTITTARIFACEAPVGNATYGIQIGTGVTPPASDDYTIETQIAHGVGAGQMQHGACGVQDPSGTGTVTFTITRAFVNGSGGTITVKEVALACMPDSSDKFALIHDAVDDAVDDGQTYTVTYTLSTTV